MNLPKVPPFRGNRFEYISFFAAFFPFAALTLTQRSSLESPYAFPLLLAVSFGLSIALMLTRRAPWPALSFYIAFSTVAIATAFSNELVFLFFWPVFCGAIASSGKLFLTLVTSLLTPIFGLIDPDVDSFARLLDSIHSAAFLQWVGFVTAATLIGWFIGFQERRTSSSLQEWRQEIVQQRKILAELLHDSVASSLTSTVLRTEALALQERSSNETLADSLESLAEQSRQSISEVRELMRILKSQEALSDPKIPISANEGLQEFQYRLQLHGFVIQFGAGLTPEAVHQQPQLLQSADSDSSSFTRFADHLKKYAANQLFIYNVLSEGATNIIKYGSQYSPVIVSTTLSPQTVEMTIWNEQRFDIQNVTQDSALSTEMGLTSLQAQSEIAKGSVSTSELTVESKHYWALSARFR